MESNKRKSHSLDVISSTSNKLQKSSQSTVENENLHNQPIPNSDDPATVLAEASCPSSTQLLNKTSTGENAQTLDETITCLTIQARRIQELLRIVDDMVLSETDSTSIVETVTNDLKNALQHLTEPYVVVPFGSFINGLVCHGSDLDFYLETHESCRTSEKIQLLLKTSARELRRSKMFKEVHAIPVARVPIVKFTHKRSECYCDLSFSNEIGVRNTLLVRFYLSLNENLKLLVLSLKHLLEIYDLHGCQRITTYMLFWLAVYYMQQCDILPSVRTVREFVSESYIVNEWDCRVPSPFSVPVHDSLSLLSHLKGFLKFYSEFNFLKFVISPYLACPLTVDDFENMRLPLDIFSNYFEKIQNVQDNTFNFSTINLQDPTELNANITKQVELSALNQFRFFCYYFFDFLNEDARDESLSEYPLKELLPKTIPANDDCINCEIFKVTLLRLPENHPSRETFKENGVNFFANRLQTLLKSIYECDVEGNISDQILRIYRRRNGLFSKKEQVAYFKCFCSREIIFRGIAKKKVDSPKKKRPDFELFVIVDTSFGGDEVSIRFESKVSVLRHLFIHTKIKTLLLQMTE